MVYSRSVLACSICIFALVGCGDSPQADGPAVSVTDIERGWEATQAILDDATDMPGQPLMSADIPMDFSYDCPAGGSADFVGQATANIIYGEADADFAYDVTFSGCAVYGVTIDGAMAYARTAEMRAGEASTTLTWSGDLSWSGDVEADCAVDVSGSTTMTLSVAGFSYDSSMTGSVCGEDASHALSWSF